MDAERQEEMKAVNSNNDGKNEQNTSVFDSDLLCSILKKRQKTLAFTLELLANENTEDIVNKTRNTRPKIPVYPFWVCHAHATCADSCEICCSCMIKMYIEAHVLSERDNVGDNYFAVSNIITNLMKKINRQNKLQKKQKELDEQKKEGEVQQSAEIKKEIPPSDWPDDLQDLMESWDQLPENEIVNPLLPLLPQMEMENLIKSVVTPTAVQSIQPKLHAGNNWHAPKQTVVARPIVAQMNNRSFLNRSVIPRPMIAQPVNGRQLMGHIVAGRQIMSHVIAGRPFLSHVISSRSLMSHSSVIQSQYPNHNAGSRAVISGLIGHHPYPTSVQRQINQNLTFVKYNSKKSTVRPDQMKKK